MWFQQVVKLGIRTFSEHITFYNNVKVFSFILFTCFQQKQYKGTISFFGNFFCRGIWKKCNISSEYNIWGVPSILIALIIIITASPEECMVFNGALPEVLSIMGTETGECIAFCVFWILGKKVRKGYKMVSNSRQITNIKACNGYYPRRTERWPAFIQKITL